jgi:hypothetical protein
MYIDTEQLTQVLTNLGLVNIKLDASIDDCHGSQLFVFIQMVFNNVNTKKFFGTISFHGKTRCKDIVFKGVMLNFWKLMSPFINVCQSPEKELQT